MARDETKQLVELSSDLHKIAMKINNRWESWEDPDVELAKLSILLEVQQLITERIVNTDGVK